MHICDNRRCVNPAHLALGTKRDNSRDMSQKGRVKYPGLHGECHGEAKLTDAAVTEIRGTTTTGRELAHKFGVSESAISLVRRGKSWRHIADQPDFDPVGDFIAQTMFTRGGTAAYEPLPLIDGEASA